MSSPSKKEQAGLVGLALIIGAALIAIILVASYYGGIIGNRVKANYNRAVVTTKINQAINTPTFAQAVYERFFNECEDVAADNTKIEIATARVKATQAEPDDQFGQKAGRVADAIADLSGLKSLQVEVAAQYNAQSEEWTRATFKAAGLPPRLDPPFDNINCEGD